MVTQKPTARPSKKNNNTIDLPKEVSEAITECGGLNQLLNIIEPEEIDPEATLHKILSDKTRLQILWSIRHCDMCPCVLKVLLKISDSRLSYHLNVLEEAGLINSYKKKNWKIYSITKKGRLI